MLLVKQVTHHKMYFLDSLGLLFLYNLDDIGNELRHACCPQRILPNSMRSFPLGIINSSRKCSYVLAKNAIAVVIATTIITAYY